MYRGTNNIGEANDKRSVRLHQAPGGNSTIDLSVHNL